MLTSSVIICTRNRPDDLARALASLSVQTVPITELILVDSSDWPVIKQKVIAQWVDWYTAHAIHFEYVHTRPGLPYQRNIGITYAHADLVYFFDDDVQLLPDYISQMNALFEQYPHCAGGMGNVLNS